jgi:2-keto-myo-inositol isomerase
MKPSLNGATMALANLDIGLRAAGAAGFEFIEIPSVKLRQFLKTNSIADLKALLVETSVKPISINSIEHITFSDDAAYANVRTECEELAAIAEAIDCPYIVIVPGEFPPGGLSSYEVIEETVRVLRELASIAERHNRGLAFQFQSQTNCSVQTLELADEIIQKVNRRNIGLAIDSFHFYVGNSTIKMIDAIDPKRLFVFQLNDADDLPSGQLTDAHRALPGQGSLPLLEIVAALRQIGYEGTAGVEVSRPEYSERDPFELAREVKAAIDGVLNRS